MAENNSLRSVGNTSNFITFNQFSAKKTAVSNSKFITTW